MSEQELDVCESEDREARQDRVGGLGGRAFRGGAGPAVGRRGAERARRASAARRGRTAARRWPGVRPGAGRCAVDGARVRTAIGELPGGGRLADEVIDELLAGASSEEEIVGPGGLLAQLTKRLVERALEVELTEHLGYEPHAEPPGGAGNTRNGTTAKTLQTEHGPVAIQTPRDRNGSFEPQIVRKRQRRFAGFDDKDPPRSTRAACRCATSRRTSRRSTG